MIDKRDFQTIDIFSGERKRKKPRVCALTSTKKIAAISSLLERQPKGEKNGKSNSRR